MSSSSYNVSQSVVGKTVKLLEIWKAQRSVHAASFTVTMMVYVDIKQKKKRMGCNTASAHLSEYT